MDIEPFGQAVYNAYVKAASLITPDSASGIQYAREPLVRHNTSVRSSSGVPFLYRNMGYWQFRPPARAGLPCKRFDCWWQAALHIRAQMRSEDTRDV